MTRLGGLLVCFHERDQQARVFPAEGSDFRTEGRELFRDFVRHCRTDAGYAALESVVTKKQKDRMESYVMAETFKYFYLLFAPDALDFDAVTFNTEAHPLRATWRSERAESDD